MPKVAPIQTNFGGGEFSPLMAGRVDTERYRTGLKVCKNFVPLIQGPLSRRPGTRWSAPTAEAGSKVARLQRFEYSVEQAYMIEISDQKFRFYRNRAAILESTVNITAATQANPVEITANAHGFSNGDEVEIQGVGGMTQLNGRRFTVSNVFTNTFELSGIDGTGYGAYTTGGTVARVYTVTHPYLEADLFQIHFTQSADNLYFFHPDYAPRKLTRSGHTAWTLTQITFLDGPYLPANAGATTITPSATTGSGITLTASAALFASTDVGRLVRIKHSSTWGYAVITGFTNSTLVTADVLSDFGSATASGNWRLGLYSDTTGYPAVGTFHDDRLVMGGCPADESRLDFSKTADYENMQPTATDGTIANDNAFAYTLNSKSVQRIRWLFSQDKGLLAGTTSSEWLIRPSSQSEALSPTNRSGTQHTNFGSADIDPVFAGDAVLFAQKSKRKIREINYSLEKEKLVAPDLSVLAEHITKPSLKQLAYMQDPQPIVWAVRNDGRLVGLTYERDIEGNVRAAWHQHPIGGFSDAGKTVPACVESVATLPSPDGTIEDTWLVVCRYINGQTVRYVEHLTQFFDDQILQEDSFFVDSGLTYSGAPASTISGLWHLEGETLSVLVDGAVAPDVVVTNGQITLAAPGSKVQIGYMYNSDMQTLRIDAGAADGTAIGKTRRTHRLGVMLDRSLGLKMGTSFDALDEVIFREAGDPLGEAVPLFTGIKSQVLDADYDFENEIALRQAQPLPCTILAVMPRMHTQDA